MESHNSRKAPIRREGCYPCIIQKVYCEKSSPCFNCVKHATSRTSYLMGRMCIRTLDQARSGGAFRNLKGLLSGKECPERETSSLCREERWKICVDPDSEGMTLEIPVRVLKNTTVLQSFVYLATWGRAFQSVEPIYSLPEHAVSIINRNLLRWAVEHRTRHTHNSFEESIHFLMVDYAGSETPYSDSVRKILEFRCLYRVWNSDRRFSYISPDGSHSSLPENIRRTLQHTFLVRLMELESEILKIHHKLVPVGVITGEETVATRFGIWLFFLSHILVQREMIKSSVWQGDGALEAYQSMRMHASEILVQTVVLTKLITRTGIPKDTRGLPDGLPESFGPLFERVISLIPSFG